MVDPSQHQEMGMSQLFDASLRTQGDEQVKLNKKIFLFA
jgi:hypothetical protein